MRFKDVASLTDLPIEGVREQFRNEEVIAVLPVSGDAPGSQALLVATAIKLAILTGYAGPERYHWLTHWAPWAAVRLSEEEAIPGADESYGLSIEVDGLRFHARLSGPAGRRALADFVVATGARREALALPS